MTSFRTRQQNNKNNLKQKWFGTFQTIFLRILLSFNISLLEKNNSHGDKNDDIRNQQKG